MNIAVICIGDELLSGATLNTNLSVIGDEFRTCGWDINESLTVKDSYKPIQKALNYLLQDHQIIITSGGLGPTADDLTTEAIATCFGLGVERNEEAAKNIREFWSRRRPGEPSERIMSQALVPAGASIIPNRIGTAPGVHLQVDVDGKERHIFMLPGPPLELVPMLKTQLIPILKSVIKEKIFAQTLYITGVPESFAEEMVDPVLEKYPDLTAAFCAAPEGLKVTLKCGSEAVLQKGIAETDAIFGLSVMRNGRTITEETVSLLKREKLTLATAESCTGGMITSAITDVAGASEILMGGIVTYSNDWKTTFLGVSKEIIESEGAVSESCARAMLKGLINKYHVDAGISVTGIAGPGGGTPDKPVGTVFIGTAINQTYHVKKYQFSGGREMIRRRTVSAALHQLRNMIHNS